MIPVKVVFVVLIPVEMIQLVEILPETQTTNGRKCYVLRNFYTAHDGDIDSTIRDGYSKCRTDVPILFSTGHFLDVEDLVEA